MQKTSKHIHIFLIIWMMILGNYSFSQTLKNRLKNNDYKYFICDIIDRDTDRAIKMALAELEKNPNNSDILFTLCVSYAQKQEIDSGLFYFRKAINEGLPFERFLAGPRQLLEPLYKTKEFKKYLKKNKVKLLHGPMLGDVTHKSANFWIRTYHEVEFEIHLIETENKNKTVLKSSKSRTSAKNDYTGVTKVKNLKPNTIYEYELYIDNKPIKIEPKPNFKTYPLPYSKESFQIVFSGGSNYNPKYEKMWDTILSYNPLAFLSLGDFTYFNIADVAEHQRYIYYRRMSRPEFRRLSANTSNYFIYDDHDFGGNDCIGGPNVDFPAWKNDVTLKTFTLLIRLMVVKKHPVVGIK